MRSRHSLTSPTDRDHSYLNSTEVAALLGISVRTVCLWAECSELPAYKVGRRWLFRRDSILEWLERSRSGPAESGRVQSVSRPTNAAIAAYSFSKTRL
jgi:excisionase family DNA binding protein